MNACVHLIVYIHDVTIWCLTYDIISILQKLAVIILGFGSLLRVLAKKGFYFLLPVCLFICCQNVQIFLNRFFF